MSYSAQLFDAYKVARGYESDRQAAISLDVQAQFITQIRKGERHWPDEKAVYMAEQSGIDPREALAAIAADKANPQVKDLWESIVKSLRLGCFAALGALTLSVSPRVEAAPNGYGSIAHNVYYVK